MEAGYKEKIWKNDFAEFEMDFDGNGSIGFIIREEQRLAYIKAIGRLKMKWPDLIEVKVSIADFGNGSISTEGSVVICEEDPEKFRREIFKYVTSDIYSDAWIIDRKKNEEGFKQALSYSKDRNGKNISEKLKVMLFCSNGNIRLIMEP